MRSRLALSRVESVLLALTAVTKNDTFCDAGYCTSAAANPYPASDDDYQSCSPDGDYCSNAAMCCSYECNAGICASSYGASRRQLSARRLEATNVASSDASTECYMYFDVSVVPKSVYDVKKLLLIQMSGDDPKTA